MGIISADKEIVIILVVGGVSSITSCGHSHFHSSKRSQLTALDMSELRVLQTFHDEK